MFRDSDLRRMSPSNVTNCRKVFLHDTGDEVATASARAYFNTVSGEMETGDVLALKSATSFKVFNITKDRDDVIELAEVTN